MAYLDESYNYGIAKNLGVSNELLEALEDSYENISFAVNRKGDVIFKSAAPGGTPDANNNISSTTDVDYRNGTFWVYQTGATGPITNEVYMKTQTIISGGSKTALWVRLG